MEQKERQTSLVVNRIALWIGAAQMWMGHKSLCVCFTVGSCPFPQSYWPISQLLREHRRLSEGRVVCRFPILPYSFAWIFHSPNQTALSKEFLSLDFSNGRQACLQPSATPPTWLGNWPLIGRSGCRLWESLGITALLRRCSRGASITCKGFLPKMFNLNLIQPLLPVYKNKRNTETR